MTENKKIIGKINIDLIRGEFTPKFYLIDEGERMTEKYRVHDLAKFHYSEIGEYIDENHTDRPLRNDILVGLLNQLNDENEQLKQSNSQLARVNREGVRKVQKLSEENEQLKAQLRKGEDVCGICKHQYLTKTNVDEYYIAKCKKEHLECSKGTVNYCEDFEYVKILDLFRRITKGDV